MFPAGWIGTALALLAGMARGVVIPFALVGLLLGVSPDAAARAPRRQVSPTIEATPRGSGSRAELPRPTIRLRDIDPLLVKACRAMSQAYAPFSGVHAGCALTVQRGRGVAVHTGFNSESKGDLQLCAEQSAMATLPRGEAAVHPVQKIAVVGDKALPRPCGRCLQVLSEVGTPETVVVAASLRGESACYTLRELMPMDFPVASRRELGPYRPLITQALRAYRASLNHGTNRYRPAFGTAVQTDRGGVYTGMVIKDTASTFTPATETPLDELAKDNALSRRSQRLQTVVIVGRSLNGQAGALPLPTGDERQHLVDINPEATVVLYNPVSRAGAVLRAGDLLPHAYKR